MPLRGSIYSHCILSGHFPWHTSQSHAGFTGGPRSGKKTCWGHTLAHEGSIYGAMPLRGSISDVGESVQFLNRRKIMRTWSECHHYFFLSFFLGLLPNKSLIYPLAPPEEETRPRRRLDSQPRARRPRATPKAQRPQNFAPETLALLATTFTLKEGLTFQIPFPSVRSVFFFSFNLIPLEKE